MSSGTFAQKTANFASTAKKRLNTIRRAAVIELFSSVIEDTPVLTGRLRGNWQTSIGSPIRSEVGNRSGAEATKEATEGALQLKGDDTIFLRNNLPYAAVIEYEGWSHTKAPEGMMRKNVIRIAEIMQKKIREAKK